MTDLPTYLSIIIPAYNEADRIIPTIEDVINYCQSKSFRYEIIVVSDGSEDKTVQIVNATFHLQKERMSRGIGIVLGEESNHGKGYSVRKGMLHSKGELAIFCDADGSTPFLEIEKMLPFLGQYDVCIGSRALAGADIVRRQNLVRQTMGKTFNFLVRQLTQLPFKDTQCGFKLFTRQAVNTIFPRVRQNDFSFDVELLDLALRSELKVKEIPIRWINHPHSKVRIGQDSFNMLKNLITMRRQPSSD